VSQFHAKARRNDGADRYRLPVPTGTGAGTGVSSDRCRYGGVPTGGPTVGDMVGDRTKHEKAGSGINVCIVYVMYRVYETNMIMNRRRDSRASAEHSIFNTAVTEITAVYAENRIALEVVRSGAEAHLSCLLLSLFRSLSCIYRTLCPRPWSLVWLGGLALYTTRDTLPRGSCPWFGTKGSPVSSSSVS
jgi:hypothetical protein